ncbi:MAG: iron-containing alcohol dehydrogenase [Oscillospiraceae bacterium]|nr:iron-containing alcohol dehydrogenase [Oscillospiraceae bacterium]
MENFIYSIPTKIYFGRGQIEKLAEAIKPLGRRVVMVYGGGSVKKIGLYGRAVDILNENGIQFAELAGVEPNPRVDSVRRGAALCREFKADVVLALGGGSTIDCAKAIAAAAFYDGDAWDIVVDDSKIQKALTVVSVLTLSATGSEMDTFAVISNPETKDKLGLGSELLRPAASILDPEYTFSVSAYQTAAGTADIMSHLFEAYFTNVKGAYFQRRMAEAMLKTCVEYGVRAIEKPDDYEARANLMWASSWAINDLLAWGNGCGWTVHPMEHELSAYYDITHGVGLAILTPHWMRHVLSEKTAPQFAEYGVNVWGLDSTLPAMEIAQKAIEKTAEYFVKMGLPTRLSQVGIGEENLEVMAKKAAAHLGGAYVPLNCGEVLSIYRAAL